MYNTKTVIALLWMFLLTIICSHLYAQLYNNNNKELFIKGEENWFQRNLPEAKYYLFQYLQNQSIPTDSNDVVNANDLLANLYLTLSVYDSAVYFSLNSFQAINHIKNKRLLPNLYQTKGRIYKQLGDIQAAMQYLITADSLYIKSPEQVLKNNAIYTAIALGNIFLEQKQTTNANEYYELALSRAILINDTQGINNCYEALGIFYAANHQYEKAKSLYRLLLKDTSAGYIYQRLYSYLGMGDVQLGLNNNDSAMFFYSLAKKGVIKEKEFYQVDAVYTRMAAASFRSANFIKAAQYADSALYWALKNKNLQQVITAYGHLSEAASALQQYEKAVFYLQQKALYSDTFLSKKNLEISNNLYILNNIRQKDEAIVSLNNSDKANKELIKKSSAVNYLLIGIIIFTALIFIIFLNRVKLKKQLEKNKAIIEERERIISDLHDDVGATLSSMHIYGDLAGNIWENQPGESRKMIEKISATSKDLMARMGDIIWSMKPADEEKYSLEARLKNYINELLSPKNILCEFDIDEKISASIKNPEIRKNILLIAKEAINNIAKYSEASEAFLSFRQQNQTALLTISDNGKGYETEEINAGNGIPNIQFRCKQLNGECAVNAVPGKGVHIVCSFPLTNISYTC